MSPPFRTAGPPQRSLPRRAGPWLLLLAGSTLVGVYFATQSYANPEIRATLNWRKAFAVNLTYYWLWGAAVPLVVALARRWCFEAGRWGRALLVHALASVAAASAIVAAAEAVLTYGFGIRGEPLSATLAYSLGANFHSLVPTYWLILAGFYAVDYYLKFRDREVRAKLLEARLAEAHLRALRMQLQPHFLFNTLNSISSLMYSDLEAADSMMSRLGDFLRLTLESDGAQEVTLGRELEFVEHYLAIERIRFEQRLVVAIDVDPPARRALVPSMVLQPLVENALRHGINHRPDGGRIALTGERQGGRLRLRLTNEGSTLISAEASQRQRIGLANTRERLAQLYGDDHSLRFEELAGGGAAVTLELPWRIADEAPDDDRRRRTVGAREAAGAAVAT